MMSEFPQWFPLWFLLRFPLRFPALSVQGRRFPLGSCDRRDPRSLTSIPLSILAVSEGPSS